jgi:hypothetical protein
LSPITSSIFLFAACRLKEAGSNAGGFLIEVGPPVLLLNC